jgi:hypothetical protein
VRRPGAVAVIVGAIVAFAVHGRQWRWTGFTGKGFRDWLDVMIAPFLLPLACRVVHAYHTSARVAARR